MGRTHRGMKIFFLKRNPLTTSRRACPSPAISCMLALEAWERRHGVVVHRARATALARGRKRWQPPTVSAVSSARIAIVSRSRAAIGRGHASKPPRRLPPARRRRMHGPQLPSAAPAACACTMSSGRRLPPATGVVRVGVVLSGGDADGAEGLRSVKDHGVPLSSRFMDS
jgi:hypothetical protein